MGNQVLVTDELHDYMVAHGMPREHADDYLRDAKRLAARVHWVEEVELLDPGDEVDDAPKRLLVVEQRVRTRGRIEADRR